MEGGGTEGEGNGEVEVELICLLEGKESGQGCILRSCKRGNRHIQATTLVSRTIISLPPSLSPSFTSSFLRQSPRAWKWRWP